jgi:hypothetical protein
MGKTSRSRCTSHVATIASNRILAAYRFRLLESSPTAISSSTFRHSPTDGSRVLAITDAVGSST